MRKKAGISQKSPTPGVPPANPAPAAAQVLALPFPSRAKLALALVLGLPVFVAWLVPGILAPFLLAGLLAYLGNPMVNALQRVLGRLPRRFARGLGIVPSGTRTLSVTLLFLWLLTVIALFGFPLLISLLSNIYALADSITVRSPAEYQELVRRTVADYEKKLESVPGLSQAVKRFVSDPQHLGTIGTVFEATARFAGRQVQNMASVLVRLFSAGASLALVPLLVFYVLVDWDRLQRSFRNAVPVVYQPWFDDFVGRLDRTLGGYIRGQLLICTVFGVAMTTGLWLLDVPYALLLGPLAGAADFVPYMGTLVGLLPATLLVLIHHGFVVQTLWTLGGLLLLFLTLQAFEGFYLQPRIMSNQVGLHPLAILMALALGQELAGLYGLLLAVPAAAFLKVLQADFRRLLYEPAEGETRLDPAG